MELLPAAGGPSSMTISSSPTHVRGRGLKQWWLPRTSMHRYIYWDTVARHVIAGGDKQCGAQQHSPCPKQESARDLLGDFIMAMR